MNLLFAIAAILCFLLAYFGVSFSKPVVDLGFAFFVCVFLPWPAGWRYPGP